MKITTLADIMKHSRKPSAKYSHLQSWVKEHRNQLSNLYGKGVLASDTFYRTAPCSDKSFKSFIKQQLTKHSPKSVSK